MNERLSSENVRVPHIIVKNINLGYLILEDYGSQHYLDILNEGNYQELYIKAIDEIVKMQKAETTGLPVYDREFLLFEMDLMQEWYLEKYLQISISGEQQRLIEKTLAMIANTVLEQPQNVFLHRDFHSRNLMLMQDNSVGVIDFQDARSGAVTYDLVSLLKDCYIAWDRKTVEALALYYRDMAGLHVDDATFLKWFDFAGLQRHIKVLGIFSRLHLRDGKSGYLKDIPLTRQYVLDVAERYTETRALGVLLREQFSRAD
jgi:aminoglycoside/choline kinase family phosphotransferase